MISIKGNSYFPFALWQIHIRTTDAHTIHTKIGDVYAHTLYVWSVWNMTATLDSSDKKKRACLLYLNMQK